MDLRRETSTDVRKFILSLFKKGKFYRELAKIVGRSHSCVQKIIERFKSDGLIENKTGRGRKSILSDVAKRKVLKDIKIDPKLSAVKLAAETSRIIGRSVSAETVGAAVAEWVITPLGGAPHSLRSIGLDRNFIFQQDNNPKHTACMVKMWCRFHCKQQLHTPPQSPDINVIGNLWATLETAVQKHQIRNKAHLKQVLQEWDKISLDTTKKLVESVPRRLEHIIKAKEQATKY
ncbi:transposable element Tc1 transposase [Trichonephila clavipes]|nr:transposable element Tc1 transposase [Trichonephila clavipes]